MPAININSPPTIVRPLTLAGTISANMIYDPVIPTEKENPMNSLTMQNVTTSAANPMVNKPNMTIRSASSKRFLRPIRSAAKV